jgi:hypothetical protein
MGKYKGNRNFASFGSSKKFNSSLRENGGSITSKLDDLVTSYKFGEGMMGFSGIGSSFNKGEIGSLFVKGEMASSFIKGKMAR